MSGDDFQLVFKTNDKEFLKRNKDAGLAAKRNSLKEAGRKVIADVLSAADGNMSGDKLQKRMKQYASASIADMLAAAISLSDSHFKYYDSALPVSAAVTDVVVKNGSIEAVKYTVEGDSAERIIQGATLAC